MNTATDGACNNPASTTEKEPSEDKIKNETIINEAFFLESINTSQNINPSYGYGCSGAYYILTIVVESKSNIKTAITPNGDGYNDKLDFSQFTDIDWQLYPQSSLEIFNRWGQELYRQEPYLQGWAGENKNGNDLPEGDYFFVLKLKPSGEVLKGVVHLFR